MRSCTAARLVGRKTHSRWDFAVVAVVAAADVGGGGGGGVGVGVGPGT